ncbi:hypothetical protein CUMW_276350 [Citrus unshiu]|uniref:Thioredoxin domain-containing protein n=1 Tax=Citrus unshiu TaxID=55188 RepID=A0A2H5N360_CITUN|nr:hypothetical protein CUMW_276350 [Citrus unshiu]
MPRSTPTAARKSSWARPFASSGGSDPTSYPILAVNFYAPWCYWSKRLTSSHDVVNNFSSFSLSLYLPHYFFFFQKPSWEKAAKTMRERYDPEMDGRILLAKVDCTEEVELCRRHHIQAYPSIRIFRKGSDVR